MDTLCVGGSFNPIHYGHLRCAEAAAAANALGRVLLIPSAQPPHKPGASDLASAEDRLAMCRLAADAMNGPTSQVRFEADDLELRREGPSYTLHTVRQLKQRGWKTVSWMIGADMLMYLPHWHRAEELVREVDFVIVARPGWQMDWSQLPQAFQSLQANVVEAPRLDISATDLRRRIAAGLGIEGLTPPEVIAYIGAKGLYA